MTHSVLVNSLAAGLPSSLPKDLIMKESQKNVTDKDWTTEEEETGRERQRRKAMDMKESENIVMATARIRQQRSSVIIARGECA